MYCWQERSGYFDLNAEFNTEFDIFHLPPLGICPADWIRAAAENEYELFVCTKIMHAIIIVVENDDVVWLPA